MKYFNYFFKLNFLFDYIFFNKYLIFITDIDYHKKILFFNKFKKIFSLGLISNNFNP